MKLWIGVTDNDWFRFLRSLSGVEEVNFWQPGGKSTFKALKPGELFLFKLHYPENFIVGGGFFVHSTRLPYTLAWETFGLMRTAPTLVAYRRGAWENHHEAERVATHDGLTGLISFRRGRVVKKLAASGFMDGDVVHLKPHLDALRRSVEFAWSAETSVDPLNWVPTNPASGQCAVTALLVQELLGGTLVRAKVQDGTHYWNVLPDGDEIDLTRQQFGNGMKIEALPEPRSRDYVLSFPDTRNRYLILRDRVLRRLAAALTEPQDDSSEPE